MTITARCHCGDIAFSIDGEIPSKLTRCTCSICAKHGALYAYYAPEQFQVNAKPGADSIYRWNTMQVAHHSCARCACVTYTDSPRSVTMEAGTARRDALARTRDCSIISMRRRRRRKSSTARTSGDDTAASLRRGALRFACTQTGRQR